MQFIMPLVSILFWAGVVGFFWFWWSPRTFGRFMGSKFLKATNNEPRKIAGAQILGLFVVGIVLTIVFWNIHPLSVLPIWFAWFKVFQKMTKLSKKVSSGSDTQSA